MNEIDKKYFQSLMDEVHHQFIAAVESERKLKHNSVLNIADGRVFAGTQALNLGLIDTIGTYENAVMITADLAGIRGEPSIVKERKRGISIFDRLFGRSNLAGLLGLKDNMLDQSILQYRMSESY
jgi:ClpP class serine protease